MQPDKLKILELVAIRGKGGTGASVVNFAKRLSKSGIKVHVVCFKRSDVYRKLKDHPEIQVITGIKMPRKLKPLAFIRDVIKLTKILIYEKYQVIHTHSSPDANLGLILKLLFPHTKLVRTRHIPVPFSSDVKQKFFDIVIARSFCVFESIKKANSTHKIFIIYDGIESKRKREKRKNSELTIGCISRYAKVKGLPFFILSLKELSKIWIFKAFIAGRTRKVEGKIPIKKLSALADKLGVKDKIEFMDYVNDVETLYTRTDIATLTSIDSEGSSRVTLEAASYGIPVVVSKVGSLPELVEEGKTGFTCDPANVEEFYHKYTLLFSQAKLRKKLGLNAMNRADRAFSLEKNVEKFLRLIL